LAALFLGFARGCGCHVLLKSNRVVALCFPRFG
jgi:hypothetical protein